MDVAHPKPVTFCGAGNPRDIGLENHLLFSRPLKVCETSVLGPAFASEEGNSVKHGDSIK